MKLDLSNSFDLKRFKQRSETLIGKQSRIELKEVREARTIKQNKYIHVLFKLFGINFGYTEAEAKTFLKRECSFMRYEKNGQAFLKHTSKLDTKELTEFIEWIRNYSSLNDCYLPTADEYKENRFNIDKDIDSHKQYL